MAFFIRSIDNAPLTFDREQQQFLRAISTGIFSGLKIVRGSTGFNITKDGGVYAINGMVIYDDLQETDLFNLGTPSADEHHLVYVTFDPDNDTEPTYATKSGTFSSPATLTPTEASNGFVIADVWVPNTATDITDATINNRDIIPLPGDILGLLGIQKIITSRRMIIAKSGSNYVTHFDELKVLNFSPNKGVDVAPTQFPFVVHEVISDTASTLYNTSGDGYEISIDPSTDRYILVYAIDPDDGSSSGNITARGLTLSETSTLAGLTELSDLLGNDDGTYTNEDSYPFRPDLKNTTVLCVIDTTYDTVVWANGIATEVGKEFYEGQYAQYAQSASSSAYATSTVPSGGDLAFDDILDNAAILHAATLDNAYDSFETGAAAGAGRSVSVDSGPVALNHAGLDGTGTAIPDGGNNPFVSSLEINLDSDDNQSTVFDEIERGLDVVSTQEQTTRKTLTGRRPFYDTVNAQALNNVNVDLDYVNSEIKVTFSSGSPDTDDWFSMHEAARAHWNSRWITFPSVTGDASEKAYKLKANEVGDYFFLEDSDGNTDIPTAYAGDFTALPETTPATVWEIHNQIADYSVLQDLEIHGDLYGPGATALKSNMLMSGYDSIQDFIENTSDGGANTSVNSRSAGDIGFVNMPWRSVGQAHGTSGRKVTSVGGSTAVTGNTVRCDGKYVYIVGNTTAGAAGKVVVYNSKDMSYEWEFFTTNGVTSGTPLTVASNGKTLVLGYESTATGTPHIEAWDIASTANQWSQDTITSTGDGHPSRIIVHNNIIYTSIQDNGIDQMFSILRMDSGAVVTDSTVLAMARDGDEGSILDAYSDKIIILSYASSSNTAVYPSILDREATVTYDGAALLSDVETTYDMCLNSRYMYVLAEKSGQTGLYLFQFGISSSGVFTKINERLLTANTVLAVGDTSFCEASEDRLCISYQDTSTPTEQVLEILSVEPDLTNILYERREDTSTFNIGGMDIDHQDLFIHDSVEDSLYPISLGKIGGNWTRITNNEESITAATPISRWLALPAGSY